jgi:MerR family transcriptional regulator, light-induced transcriptional regulator
MADAHHAIQAVVRRTGLSAHVIRIWEKRYGAVKPHRTETNRRLYSDEQIERLILLREITRTGESIGQMARLPTEKLRALTRHSAAANGVQSAPAARASRDPSSLLLEESLAAVRGLDSRALEETLKKGALELGSQGLLQRLIAPLAQKIGELWRDGAITAAHEHFASAVIRIFLGHATKPFAGTDHAPVLLVGTPAGQIHELGALLAGAAAANLGWNVTYLGASLPAAEIASAARQSRARAVALSIVYPEDDPRLEGELLRLRELIDPGVPILVGGRAMLAYADALDAIAAVQMKDLPSLCATLDGLRTPARKGKR